MTIPRALIIILAILAMSCNNIKQTLAQASTVSEIVQYPEKFSKHDFFAIGMVASNMDAWILKTFTIKDEEGNTILVKTTRSVVPSIGQMVTIHVILKEGYSFNDNRGLYLVEISP